MWEPKDTAFSRRLVREPTHLRAPHRHALLSVDVELCFLQLDDKSDVRARVEEYLKVAREGKVIVYTDGSRDPVRKRAGFGVYIEGVEVEHSVRITDESSVFTTELMALLWALRWVERERPREVIICSDSAAALQAIKTGKSKARPDLVTDILEVLYRIVDTGVTLCWVPGHAGVEGNEKVDSLAKESLDREIEIQLPLGRVELRGIIKENLMREWQAGWESEVKGRHYHLVQPKIDKKCNCNALSRRDEVKLCRLRLGHCGLNKNLLLIGKHDTGLCQCGQSESVAHVFLVCGNFNAERQRL